MPGTFSRMTYLGRTSRIILMVAGQRFLSSSAPRLSPATEWGWQGNPPVMMSTTPLNCSPSRVDISPQIGASSRILSLILALIISCGYLSHSTYITVLVGIPVSFKPSENPP